MAVTKWAVRVGDCREVLKRIPANFVDTIITDPPYGINFMGQEWDSFGREIPAGIAVSERGGIDPKAGATGKAHSHGLAGHDGAAFQAWCLEWARECLRVLKPGGILLCFGGTRTYHRMTCAIEDAGFEVRDCVMWMFGSGYPKGHDISKAVDKATRSAALAESWSGWNTSLKPAYEPIVVAMKPLDGTFAANALKYGVAGLNIDGCRVPHVTVGDGNLALNPHLRTHINGGNGGNIIAHEDARRVVIPHEQGRWPANVILDGSEEVLAAFPDAPGQQGDLNETGRDRPGHGRFGKMGPPKSHKARKDSNQSAARFFYCAKSSKKDRNFGLEDGVGVTNTHPT